MYDFLFFRLLAVPSEDKTTPPNRTIQSIIQALFTPYLTKLITRVTTNEVSHMPCHVIIT